MAAIGARVRLLVSGPEPSPPEDLIPWSPEERDVDDRDVDDRDVEERVRDTAYFDEPSAPDGRVRLRLAPTRSAAVATGTVALLVAAISFWWVLSDRPRSLAVGTSSAVVVSSPRASSTAASPKPSDLAASAASSAPPGSASLQSRASSSAGEGAGSSIQVDVVGQVAHPGVVALPATARVVDAITAAGGALPGVDLNSLNLARHVVDGEQIAVGVAGASDAVPPAQPNNAAATGAASSARVNLNSATAAQLDSLPGVGPVLAKSIVDWRSAHGRFASVDQLREVSGIGAAKFASLKNAVTV